MRLGDGDQLRHPRPCGLPGPGKPDRFFAKRVRGLEYHADVFETGQRSDAAQAGRFVQGGQGASGGRFVEASSHHLIKQALQFPRRARAADEFDPRPSAVRRERFVAQQHAEHLAGLFRLDRFQAELQLFLAALDLPLAGFDGSYPRVGEVVDGVPEGVVEERIHWLVEGAQGEFGGFRRRNFCERPQGLDADTGAVVGDQLSE